MLFTPKVSSSHSNRLMNLFSETLETSFWLERMEQHRFPLQFTRHLLGSGCACSGLGQKEEFWACLFLKII